MMRKAVCYYRVSTQRQGVSGLGLEAQEHACADHATQNGLKIVQSFTEVESGKRKKRLDLNKPVSQLIAHRPKLLEAVQLCQRTGSTLIIAKLDRLARDVAFTAALMGAGIDFVAVDNPNANRLTIHILAAVAEEEARAISERTKAALCAYKRRGGLLGASLPQCRTLTKAARRRGTANGSRAQRERADEFYADVYGVVTDLRANGKTLQEIADQLNAEGRVTRRGGSWRPNQVLLVLRRAERLSKV